MSEPSHQLIGERSFQVDGTDEILVKIFAPIPDGENFRCYYLIAGLSWPGRLRYTMGVDAIGALYNALRVVGSDMREVRDTLGRDITYLGQPDLDLPTLDVHG
ncbi:MAG TPA: hypothetical protein VK533_10045 [Sphingomonas sp.]|uniref:DUF6968 family protein n=1 Tax=Sphingomonas sp. TaxID=28214 RepID=UPI002C1140D1|nr:hypothetical protein [Sphingomonas sp.]HMI19874.1 hypothetical protein [Sphingomonas sp.]